MKRVLIYILVCILIKSCSTSYTTQYASGTHMIGSRYFNDSIKISTLFYDDYHEDCKGCDNPIIRTKYFNEIKTSILRKNKRMINKLYPDLKLKKENFVSNASTFIEPYITSSYYYFPKHLYSDTLIKSKEKGIVLSVVCRDSNSYIHLIYGDERGSKPYLPIEADNIFSRTYYGKNYKIQLNENPFTVLERKFNVNDKYNYLNPILEAQNIASNYETSTAEKWLYLQASSTYSSFVQKNPFHDEIKRKTYDFLREQSKKTGTSHVDITHYDNDAINYLYKSFENKQIVMINEQHWQAKHRYFGNMMLEELYKQGFRYLAVEAIAEHDTLNLLKYPTIKTGTYIREPNFGNFIRNALKIGFELVSYEYFGVNREQNQARNIYNILQKDKNAKIFVWAGIDHINENKTDFPRMAYYLNEMSGIDPLTINQVSSDALVSSGFIPKMNNHFLAIRKTNLKNCDIYLINNIPESQLRIKPNVKQKKITLPESIKAILYANNRTFILQIFDKKEFENENYNAIPLANYMMYKEPDIYLPAGEYTLILRDAYNYTVKQIHITINI